MSQPRNPVNPAFLDSAQALVLGVVTARRANSKADADTLISSYMEEAQAAGASKDLAWSMLFIASTLWVDALLECRALHHEIPHRQVVSELALALATRDE